MKIVTVENSERVARYAFEYAKSTGRTKVTTIHKANIMKLSDGLFLETSRRVAKEYPEIKHNDMIIDNCCMQLVSNPHQFEVMNMTNLYGTITSNVICGLIGGAGLLSGRNYGDLVSITIPNPYFVRLIPTGNCEKWICDFSIQYAVFEPGTRNTGTAIAGRNVANPIAMLNASVDMLYHLGHKNHADAINEAIHKTICEDKIHTPGKHRLVNWKRTHMPNCVLIFKFDSISCRLGRQSHVDRCHPQHPQPTRGQYYSLVNTHHRNMQ